MTRIYIFLLASASYYNCAFTLYAQAPRKKAATKVTLPAIAAIRPSELQADLLRFLMTGSVVVKPAQSMN